MALTNLFSGPPAPPDGERFEPLLSLRNVRIERIVSSPRPEAVEYDQTQDEWVTLLQGEATLRVGEDVLGMGPGDCIFIPAHTPHRVLSTSEDPACLWLAVHIL
jgi:cupin 2 domain-containing protein